MNAWVKNCSVENCTITAYRDLGSIVGYADCYNGGKAIVSDCKAKNVNVICKTGSSDGTNYKSYKKSSDFHANQLVGELCTNSTISNTTAEYVTVTYDPENCFAASVNGIAYLTLPDAISAAKSGEEITLLKNIEMSSALADLYYKTLTIDLNGKTITSTSTDFINQTKNGGYIFTGSGSIKASGNLRTSNSKTSSVITFDENFTGSVEYNAAYPGTYGKITFKGGYLKPQSTFTYSTYYDKFIPDGYVLIAVTDGDYAGFYHVEKLTAENAFCQIGDKYFADITKAQEEWTNGSTLKLLKDINGSGVVADPGSGNSVTLDLNEKTLSVTSGKLVYVTSGNLTITGNGILYASSDPYSSSSYSVYVSGDGSALNIVNGTFKNSIGFENDNENQSLTITDGIFESTITQFDRLAKFEINGGTFSSTVSASNLGTLTVKGGTFNGGLSFNGKCGTLKIEGGLIEFVNSCQITVDGIVYKGTVDVTGGNIKKIYNRSGATWNITGGTFGNADPSPVAEGYKAIKQGDVWVVSAN